MTRLHLPPPKRGPRFSDLVYIGGTAMPIEGLPLYQPDAPKAYLVEAPINVPRRVAWDGLRWADDKLSDEDHGDQGRPAEPAQAGSIPASSKDCHGEKQLPTAERESLSSEKQQAVILDELPSGGAAGETRSAGLSNVPFSRSPIPVKRGERRAEVRPPHEGSNPSSSNPFLAQHRAAAAEASAMPRRAEHRKDVELAPPILSLHATLDRARERRHIDEEAYFAAIAAVDQADPLFYRGRIDPLPLIPRHAPPDSIDFARISAEMGATLPDMEDSHAM